MRLPLLQLKAGTRILNDKTKLKTEYIAPAEIEKRSFEIITQELLDKEGIVINGCESVGPPTGDSPILDVIKRCIHTTADFDYARTMYFSKGATERFCELVRQGATIVTDTNMALSGINKKRPGKHGCNIVCYMADDDVAAEASDRGVTRAQVSMERAMKLSGPVIFVIGNAPTALMTIKDHYDSGDYTPAFVIGVPVGFVNVEAAKELIIRSDIPHIVNSGRKGGSNVAAAIVNALTGKM